MKDNKLLQSLMEKPEIRNLGIKPEMISFILDSYDDIMVNELLSSGHVELPNGMNLEVIKLTDRVHVLRGVSYQSNRKYKLKLTMEDKIYKKIEKYYDDLMKEIE